MSVTPKNGGHNRIMIYGPLKRTSFAIGSMSEVSARNALAQHRLSRLSRRAAQSPDPLPREAAMVAISRRQLAGFSAIQLLCQ